MVFSEDIIKDISNKSGLLFDRAGDFESLSSSIYKETGRTIGITTLKRLFNYIQDDRKASEYTLNTISIYLGFDNWESYLKTKNIDSEWCFCSDSVYPQELTIDDIVEIKYLNRIIEFRVVEFEGGKALKVYKAVNSSLLIDDIVIVHHLKVGEKLIADKVYRKGLLGNYKTNGELSSVEVNP